MKTLAAIAAAILLVWLAASWLERRQAAEEGDGPSERGLYDCGCDYLTDTDLTGEERVRVCAESPDEAVRRGRGCAQAHSPGSVSKCTCVLWSKVDCADHDCRSNR